MKPLTKFASLTLLAGVIAYLSYAIGREHQSDEDKARYIERDNEALSCEIAISNIKGCPPRQRFVLSRDLKSGQVLVCTQWGIGLVDESSGGTNF